MAKIFPDKATPFFQYTITFFRKALIYLPYYSFCLSFSQVSVQLSLLYTMSKRDHTHVKKVGHKSEFLFGIY